MKTRKMCSCKALMTAWILFMPGILLPQDVIRLNNGREIEAKILRQAKDTLVFEKIYSPGIYHKILISEIDTIYPLSGPRPEERPAIIQRKYKSNKRMMVTGLGILAGGAAITLGAGIYALTGGVDEALGGGNNPGIVPTIAGAAICVVGIIVTTVGGIGKNKYKKKLENISFDFQSNPKITGITLRVKF